MARAAGNSLRSPMARDTPCLAGKISDPKSRDGSNKILHKRFPGGHLTIENDPDHEAIDVAWLPLRDAHRHLTFPNERRIARLAWQRLSGDAASC